MIETENKTDSSKKNPQTNASREFFDYRGIGKSQAPKYKTQINSNNQKLKVWNFEFDI